MPTNSVSNLFSIIIVSKYNIHTNTFLNSKNGLTKIQSAGNQRYLSNLVGTSETTRVTTKDDNSFNQWFAGLIDGDGCFLISKKGYCSLEITVNMHDIYMLRYIQNKFGGSIKMRSGANAYRYRMHNKNGIIQIINSVNGYIQHSKRINQLHAVCQKLNIQPLMPTSMNVNSAWFAGFFDADGSIILSMSDNKNPQLTIQVCNKEYKDVLEYQKTFGGYIYFDKSQNGYYKWSIQSFKDNITFYSYFKNQTFRSSKSKRFHLINKYYNLINLKAYKPNSPYHKAWIYFINKWNNIHQLNILLLMI